MRRQAEVDGQQATPRPTSLAHNPEVVVQTSDEEGGGGKRPMPIRSRTPSIVSEDAVKVRENEIRKNIHTISLAIIALVSTGFALHALQGVLVPFVLALMLVYILYPLIDALSRTDGVTVRHPSSRCLPLPQRLEQSWVVRGWERVRGGFEKMCLHRFPRWLAVCTSFGSCFLVVSLSILLIVQSVQGILANGDKYSARTKIVMDEVSAFFQTFKIGIDGEAITKTLLPLASVTEVTLNVGVSIVNTVKDVLFVFLLAVCIAVAQKSEKKRTSVQVEIDNRIHEYILRKTLLSLLSGLFQWMVMLMIRLEASFTFGIAAFFLNFIPALGPTIAALLPLPLIVLDESINTVYGCIGVILPLLFHLIISNIVEPKVVGSAMDLSPISLLLSFLIWSSVWGVPGMVLSAPITGVVKIILKEVDHPLTRTTVAVLEGRWGDAMHTQVHAKDAAEK